MDSKSLIRRNWDVSLRRVHCQGNAPVDFLAKLGTSLSIHGTQVPKQSHPDLETLLTP